MSEPQAEVSDELLRHAQRGESSAFAQIVRAHQRSVFGLALRMLSDREQARDMAQEVFLQLYRKLGDIESARHLRFWVHRVTANLTIDRLRRAPRAQLVSLDESVEVAAQTVDTDPILRRHLHALMAELAPAARAVLLLRYQEDLDPVEIASALDMSINTVKSHLKRSLALLRRKLLGDNANDEGRDE